MTLKAWHVCLVGLVAFTLTSLFLISSQNLSASPILQSPQVQAAFSQPSYDPGQTAVFHVTDSSLDTLFSCTATWVDADPAGDEWLAGETYWNIFSGDPAPPAYQGFNSGCAFVSTSTTPLEEAPDLGNESWAATVNGVETAIAEFYADDEFLGDTALSTDVTSTSTVAIPFFFHAQNSYPASAQRVKVTSVADTAGEWVSLVEVASTTDSTAATRSGVFRGSVELRVDAATVEGDGVVRVDGVGDVIQLTYYGPSGQTAVSAASATVGGLPPTPTPTSTPTPTPLPDIAFAQPSFMANERAVIYITDSGLNSLSSCTVRWVDAVPSGSWDILTEWNIFTGEPAPSTYKRFGSSCGFVSNTDTPVEPIPVPWLGRPWLATVNGDQRHVREYHDGGVTIDITTTMSATTIAVPFYYHVHDVYPASAQRARVSSSADPVGEWAALTEVASTADVDPAFDSAVFRGSFELRADAPVVEGDGVVSVDAGGDRLRLSYYGPSGNNVVGVSTALVIAEEPADTPVPTAARRRRPTPTPTPTITPTPTPVPVVRRIATLTPTPAPTYTPTPTATQTATRTATPEATPTRTAAPTLTPTLTAVPSPTPTPSPTFPPTPTPDTTYTPTPTVTLTPTPTRSPTITPTATTTVIEPRRPVPVDSPTATVPPPAMEEAVPAGGCSRPAGVPTAATALANLALLTAPLALAVGLRRRRL